MSNDQNNTKMFTRGGQITLNNLRMFAQINQKVTYWAILTALAFTLVLTYWLSPTGAIKASIIYFAAKSLVAIAQYHHVFNFTWHNQRIHVSSLAVLAEPYFYQQVLRVWAKLCFSFFVSLGLAIFAMIGSSLWLIRRGKKQAEGKHVRGAKLASNKVVAKAIKKHGASDITIADIPMVNNFEVRHMLLHGTIGAGKSQTINQLLDHIRRRGESAIIFDKGTVFTSQFYNEQTDIILNPFDERCAAWDLWVEAKTEPDFENIAESLIPMHGENDPYWVDAARTVFSTLAYRMRGWDNRSIERLLWIIMASDLKELSGYLQGSQAATLVSDKIEKTAISIRSVISTYLKSLRFLKGLPNDESFSIRDWIKQAADEKDSRFLFVSSNADHHAALRPLISMWLSMASLTLLSLPEDYNRRIWFICDEVPTLHKLPQLGETMAEVRKFGGCFVLGMQSRSQMEKIYGKAAAAEIFDLLNTRFFFRSPSADMSKFVAYELGEEEVEQSHESYSYGANTVRDGISISTNLTKRLIVSPAEIAELPDLTAYLRVPAPVPVTKVTMKYKSREKRCEGLIVRDIPGHSIMSGNNITAQTTAEEDAEGLYSSPDLTSLDKSGKPPKKSNKNKVKRKAKPKQSKLPERSHSTKVTEAHDRLTTDKQQEALQNEEANIAVTEHGDLGDEYII